MLATSPGAIALLIGAACSYTAGAAHLVCIALGAPAYRFMGAGERMARAVEAGRMQPAIVTLVVSGMLFVWGAYALSGAGVWGPLPYTPLALVAITAIYLARAVAWPLLVPRFPENSRRFWHVSSAICGFIGLLHAYGTVSLWRST